MTFAKSHISAISVLSLVSGLVLADVCLRDGLSAQTASAPASAATPATAQPGAAQSAGAAASPPGACARVTDEIIPADQLDAVMRDALTLVRLRKSAEALTCYQRALASAEALGLVTARAEATVGVGAAQRIAGRYAEAQELHERGVAMFRELADAPGEARALRNLGLDLYYRAQYDKAVATLTEAKAIYERLGDAEGLALVYGNLMYASSPGPAKDALREEALALARDRSRTRDVANECSILHEWGDELFTQGRYGEAFGRLSESLTCYTKTEERTSLATVLVSLGRVYRAHGRPDLAMPYYARALELQDREGDTLGAIQSVNAMAVTYGYLGQFDLSIRTYHEALTRAIAAQSPQTIAFLRGQLGGAYLGLRDPQRALPLLEESLRLDPRNTMWRKAQLGTVLALLQRHDEALTLANEAVAEARTRGNDQVVIALKQRENVHYYAGRLEEAHADLAEALRLIEEARNGMVGTDFMKRGFSSQYQELFSVSIELAARRGDTIGALEIAEQARARAFLDLLATRSGPTDTPGTVARSLASAGARSSGAGAAGGASGASGASGAPGATGATQGGASATTGTAAGAAAGAGASSGSGSSGSGSTGSGSAGAGSAGRTASARAGGARAHQLESTLARRGNGASSKESGEAMLAHEAVQANAAVQLDSSRTASAPTIAEVRATAKRLDSTLLIYWVGYDGLRIWVVSPAGSVRTVRVDVNEPEVRRRVNDATATLDSAAAGLGGSAGTLLRPWRRLYDTLIAPIESLLPTTPNSRLTIVPHGSLFQLSFAALQDSKGRYLLERYRLHYTPAIGVLAYTGRRAHEAAASAETLTRSALLVGDPEPLTPSLGEDPMPRLPWAGREVDEISRLVSPSRSDILTEQDASESAVRARVESADLLHFATHGVVQQQGGTSSFLALSPSRATLEARARAASANGGAVAANAVQSGATQSGSALGGSALSGSVRRGGEPSPAAASAVESSLLSTSAAGSSLGAAASAAATAAIAAAARLTEPKDDDGRLTAEEVYGLSLRARLVVLSACRTALGTVGGDGVFGFTRAFLYAGAPSVVATSWDVPDEAGYQVMRRFYRARAENERVRAAAARGRVSTSGRSASGRSMSGRSTADALRTAQLAVLAELRKGTLMATTPSGPVALHEHPLLWAGYVVVGEP